MKKGKSVDDSDLPFSFASTNPHTGKKQTPILADPCGKWEMITKAAY
jgi:hypothetical protein